MSDSATTWLERLRHTLKPSPLAELHGLLCGLLCCAEAMPDAARWRALAGAELAQDQPLDPALDRMLEQWHDATVAQLHTAPETITPLLPSDETPLRQRTEALGAWCQGLLYGLGLGQVGQRGGLSAESREFLGDAAQIAQVGLASDEAAEADEIAYAELVEYLRVGLLLILEDTRPAITRRPS